MARSLLSSVALALLGLVTTGCGAVVTEPAVGVPGTDATALCFSPACGLDATGPTDAGLQDVSSASDAGLAEAAAPCDSGVPGVTCVAQADPASMMFGGNGVLTVDDANVYWATQQGWSIDAGGPLTVIRQASRSGGPVVTLAQGEYGSIRTLRTDGAFVYWIDVWGRESGSILRVPVGGGETTTVAPWTAAAECLEFDDTNLYWTEAGGGLVVRMPKGGGPFTEVAVWNSGLSPAPIAVDPANLYWSSTELFSVSKTAVVPATTGPVVPSGEDSVLDSSWTSGACRSLAVAGSTLYAIDNTAPGPTLVSVPTSGGVVPTVLDAVSGDYAVVVGASIYTLAGTSPAQSVKAMSLDGGAATTLATTARIYDIDLASDGTLYWTTDTQVQSMKP